MYLTFFPIQIKVLVIYKTLKMLHVHIPVQANPEHVIIM